MKYYTAKLNGLTGFNILNFWKAGKLLGINETLYIRKTEVIIFGGRVLQLRTEESMVSTKRTQKMNNRKKQDSFLRREEYKLPCDAAVTRVVSVGPASVYHSEPSSSSFCLWGAPSVSFYQLPQIFADVASFSGLISNMDNSLSRQKNYVVVPGSASGDIRSVDIQPDDSIWSFILPCQF